MDIVWNGDLFYQNKSHANINRRVVIALDKLGHNVRVTSIRDVKNYDSNNEEHRLIHNFTKKNFKSDYNICKFTTAHTAEKGAKFNCLLHSNGGYTITRQEKNILDKYPITHLWLPTPECAEEVDNQLDSVSVVGLGIDSGINPKKFNLDVEPYDYKVGSMFKFMIACDGLLLTTSRPYGGCRGSDIAIESFIKEFSSSDNVCLIVKIAGNYSVINNFIDRILKTKQKPPKIIKDFGKDSQDIIVSKWKSSDCMLSPIRDCRWDAPILEALATGTPAIATDIGGPKMYGDQGVYFVHHTKTEGDLCTLWGQQPYGKDYWTEPSVEDFSKQLRYVYNNQEEAKEFGLVGSKHVLENWKWANIAQNIVDFFANNS